MRICSLLLVVSIASPVFAQTTPAPQPAPAVTLRAQAKLVVVDVVVTDRDHHPVHNLSQQDFSVLENSKPQTINSFQEHKAAAAAKLTPTAMPPGYFTNETTVPPNQAVNILLLDALNTPMQDQTYVRQQLLDYLKKSPPGNNIAIFGLSTKLVMLQGFTSDPEVLKAALLKVNSKASSQLNDVIGGNGTADTAADQNESMDNILSDALVANLQTFMDIQQSFQTMVRVKNTLDAMNVLARYLSAIPGRKNLIWFSGSFPLNVMPDVADGSNNSFAGVADAAEEYRETTNLLTARPGCGLSDRCSRAPGCPYRRWRSHRPLRRPHSPSGRGAPLADPTTAFALANFDEHQTMERMATDTGGHAFFNTNGLTDAVAKAVDDGSSYYSLSYSPGNTEWKGDFRRIQVNLAQQGYTLEYRHGYFADDPNSPTSAVSSSLDRRSRRQPRPVHDRESHDARDSRRHPDPLQGSRPAYLQRA